jgi:GST-like protein
MSAAASAISMLAPVKIEYAIDRFAMETKRLLDVRSISVWPRASMSRAPTHDRRHGPGPAAGGKFNSYGGAEFLNVQEYKNVRRWTDQIWARPAVKRGRMVNRTAGEPSEQLLERHDAGDFETKTQDKLAAN